MWDNNAIQLLRHDAYSGQNALQNIFDGNECPYYLLLAKGNNDFFLSLCLKMFIDILCHFHPHFVTKAPLISICFTCPPFLPAVGFKLNLSSTNIRFGCSGSPYIEPGDLVDAFAGVENIIIQSLFGVWIFKESTVIILYPSRYTQSINQSIYFHCCTSMVQRIYIKDPWWLIFFFVFSFFKIFLKFFIDFLYFSYVIFKYLFKIFVFIFTLSIIYLTGINVFHILYLSTHAFAFIIHVSCKIIFYFDHTISYLLYSWILFLITHIFVLRLNRKNMKNAKKIND